MGACKINPDEFSEIETHCIALYSLNNNFTNFDSFGVEHIPKKIIYWYIYSCSKYF